MGDSFNVHHGNFADVNDGLAQSTTQMGTILEDVNGTLRQIHVATQGRATPLWEEHGQRWNAAYTDMHVQLHGHTTSSNNVANTFIEGDNQGGRVMS
ncbi:MAG: hypothetical protein ACRDP6_36885 [Actinoallomurus sp.]